MTLRATTTRDHEGVSEPIATVRWSVFDDEARPIQEWDDGRADVEGDETLVERTYASDDALWVRDRVCEEKRSGGGELVAHSRPEASQGLSPATCPRRRLITRLTTKTTMLTAISTEPSEAIRFHRSQPRPALYV